MTNDRCVRASMRPLASRIVRFARERTVLVVSALAALATVPFVPPDEAYLGYFDVKTLACLFGILAVVGALRGIGLFEHAARLIVARFVTCRSAVAALVGSTLVLSMFATNDLALIMMLPLSAATLLKAGWERSLPFALIMQNLAANLGGMILPFGNPQNLYLYERFSIPLGDFLSVMAVPFAVSVVLIALCCVLFAKPEPPKATKKRASEKEAAEKFVSYLFSDEGQRVGSSNGLPVRKSVYDSEEYWELGQEGNIEYGFSSTYNGESHDMITVVHSADDQIKEIQKLGKTLTMPSGGSRIIQDSVLEAGKRYLYGGTDLDKAVEQAVSQVKLYLAE